MRTIRPIAIGDISETFRVHTATDENRRTSAQLTAVGITESNVREKLRRSYKGWLCEEQGSVVGFAIGDRSSGEMWVIAVLRGHIGRGIGGALLEKVEAWFFSEGCSELWLTTDVDTRLRAIHSTRSTAGLTGRLKTDFDI
jgi:ribosomal protein S18 acetylase RimI-like enzyme